MSTIIRIKRSTTAGDPSTLGAGELAYSAADYASVSGGGRLYIGIGAETSGDAASHLVIGGQYFTDKLDHAAGTLTASSAIITDANSKIDNLKVDNLDLNGNTLSTTDTNGNLVLAPNGTGKISVSNTAIINLSDPTNAQDASTKAYVDAQIAAVGSTGASSLFTNATHAGLTATYDSSANTVTLDVNDPTITLAGDVAGSATMTDLGNVTITVAQQADSVDLGTHTTGDYVESLVGGTGVTVGAAGESATPTIAIGQDVSTTANVTFNDVSVDGTLSSDDITAATMTASGNVVVQGNLTVNGTTTTVNSNEVNIGDAVLLLNSDETGAASQNAGIEIERGTDTNVSFLWDEATDKWSIGTGTFVAGTVEADVTGDLTGDVLDSTGAVLVDHTNKEFEGNANTADALSTARSIAIAGDQAGTVSFDGSADVTINVTTQADSVDLGAHTTGDYIESVSATTGHITVTGGTGEGSTPVLSLPNSGVTAASYGSATAIPVITVDAQGRVTAASTAAVATELTITDGSNNNTVDLLNDTLTFTGGTGLTATVGTDEVTMDLDDTAVTAGAYGAAGSVGTFTVDAQGRLTAAATLAIAITASQVTDFDEAAQDAIGAAVGAGAQTNMTATYDDAANAIDFAVPTSSTSQLGVAQFSSDNFAVASGVVTVIDLDGGSY
jgi:hypothetical protein